MSRFQRPSPMLLAAEFPRATGERAWLTASLPVLRCSQSGDGHPVLVLPGFTADDTSTRPLRRFLRGLGYTTHGWRLGINVGPTDRIIDGLSFRFDGLAAQHGRPMSIVGWSLGGIYARELARLRPDLVRQVITLGSPFRLDDRDSSNAQPLYDALATVHSTRADEPRPAEADRPPLPVPSTAIYTRTDGVVPWESSREPDGPRVESVQVPGSHSGLGHNPLALWVIADRLAQAEGEWSRFEWRRANAA